MFRKPSTVILLVLLVTLGISAESSATWKNTAWNVFKEVAMDTAIDVVQSFFRDDVNPEEVTVLKSKVSNLERQLYSVKEGGYNPSDFDSVEQTILRLTKIVNAMESRFSSLEDRVTILEKRVTIIEQDIPFIKRSIARWEGNLQNDVLKIDTSTKFVGIGYKKLTTPRNIREIIITDTQTRNLKSEIRGLKKHKVAFHYVISRYGEIKLLVEESNVAYHTRGLNTHSIGIGLIHVSGQAYPKSQINSLISLLSNITNRHQISLSMIILATQADPNNPRKKTDMSEKMFNNIREQISLR